MATKKKSRLPVYVEVEIFRATDNQAASLEKFLEDYEAVDRLGYVARKSSGLVELGHAFTVYLLPVIMSYAGNKALKIVEDRVKDWYKKHGTGSQFITLQLSTQDRVHRIGKGTRRRYRR